MIIDLKDYLVHTHTIDVEFEGKYIRIGRSKQNGTRYFQYKKYDPDNNVWIEFDINEFLDYKEYMEKIYE